jgi:uncharacterized protein (TIGR02001 family)
MYLMKKLNALVFTGVIAGTILLTTPMVSQAEVSSSATLASMYLWRGLDISDNKPAVSGDITYSHDSGFYASLWLSSEGTFDNSYESDWTIGFSGSVKDFGYDVGYYKIWYPELIDSSTGKPQTFGDAAAEAYVGLSYKDFGFKAFLDAKDDKTYKYYTLSYGYGAFSGTFGIYDDDTNSADYKHLDLSYAATDRLSFTVSKITSMGGGGTLPNPLFMISYSLPVDLK